MPTRLSTADVLICFAGWLLERHPHLHIQWNGDSSLSLWHSDKMVGLVVISNKRRLTLQGFSYQAISQTTFKRISQGELVDVADPDAFDVVYSHFATKEHP